MKQSPVNAYENAARLMRETSCWAVFSSSRGRVIGRQPSRPDQAGAFQVDGANRLTPQSIHTPWRRIRCAGRGRQARADGRRAGGTRAGALPWCLKKYRKRWPTRSPKPSHSTYRIGASAHDERAKFCGSTTCWDCSRFKAKDFVKTLRPSGDDAKGRVQALIRRGHGAILPGPDHVFSARVPKTMTPQIIAP